MISIETDGTRDELVAALREVKAWADMGGLDGPYANPDAYPAAIVRAALAKVQP